MRSAEFKEAPLARKLQRLLVEAISLCCLVIVVSQTVFHVLQYKQLFTTNAKRTAGIIARNIEPALSFGDPDGAQRFLKTLSADKSIVASVIFNAEGKEIARYDKDQGEFVQSASEFPLGVNFVRQEIHEPIQSTDSINPGVKLGSIYLKFDSSDLYLELFTTVITLGAAFLVAYLAGKILIKKYIPTITAPIEQLTETATLIANSKQYDIQIPTAECKDEIGKMTDSFNDMLRQISERDIALVSIKDDLENQVTLRTRQLATQAEELKTINEDLQHFVYIMRHDLRTPLLSLTIYLDEIREKVDELNGIFGRFENSLQQDDREILQTVHSAIEYGITTNKVAIATINRIFNAIKEITSISTLDIVRKEFDPVPMVLYVAESLAGKAQENGIDVRVGSFPSSIVSDEENLGRILACLVDNAIKYTAQCSTRIVNIYGDESEDTWALHVADTGPGVPDYMKGKAFDLFRRGDHDLNVDGAGLGLAYAKTLASRLAANIKLDTEEGVGSTFSIIVRKEA